MSKNMFLPHNLGLVRPYNYSFKVLYQYGSWFLLRIDLSPQDLSLILTKINNSLLWFTSSAILYELSSDSLKKLIVIVLRRKLIILKILDKCQLVDGVFV